MLQTYPQLRLVPIRLPIVGVSVNQMWIVPTMHCAVLMVVLMLATMEVNFERVT